MTFCHLNILSIIKKQQKTKQTNKNKTKCPFLKAEHKYQAIINSSKLAVRDKPSRQTTKAHTIRNRKGNKNIPPCQYKSKPQRSMCLGYAGQTQKAPKSRNQTSDGEGQVEGCVRFRVHILLWVIQSPLPPPPWPSNGKWQVPIGSNFG